MTPNPPHGLPLEPDGVSEPVRLKVDIIVVWGRRQPDAGALRGGDNSDRHLNVIFTPFAEE